MLFYIHSANSAVISSPFYLSLPVVTPEFNTNVNFSSVQVSYFHAVQWRFAVIIAAGKDETALSC